MGLKELISPPKRQQRCLVITEDRRLIDEYPRVDKGYMVSEPTLEAWFTVPEWLVYMKDEDNFVQILLERNCIPVPLGYIFGVNTKEQIANLTDLERISGEKFDETELEASAAANKNKFLMNTITIMGGAFCCFVLVMAAIMLVQSGKLHLPF